MPRATSWIRHPVTVRVCRVVIGILFGVAALAKLGDLQSFADQVHNFRLLPVATENLAAMVLPWVELVAALALLFGVRARSGALVASVLMVAFTAAVFLALVRGLDIECGCFGTADASTVGLSKLAQNVVMLAIATIASLRPRSPA